MMQAAVFRGVGAPLSIESVPEPQAGPGEVVLKVAYCGICGTDLHMTQHGAMTVPVGGIMGHEFAGEIVDSRVGGLKVGTRVAAMPLQECDACAPHGCQKGLAAACDQSGFIGCGGVPTAFAPGAYAQFVKVRESQVVPLPERVSLRDGALVEPLSVGAHAVAKAGDLDGKRVMILGAGPIGLTTAISARLAGARTVVISELSPLRRERAGMVGADAVIDPNAAPVAEAFADVAGGRPDVVFECVGVPGLIGQAVDLAGPLGRVVVVGVCMVEDRFFPAAAILKEVNMQFVIGYTRADFDRVIGHLDAGRIDGDALVSATIGLEELPGVFEDLRTPNRHSKVLIRPNAH
jgi:(R,R)-butanediol dehydrogenase/meso-butanediol dehydrogenase/diacetyl reductase